MKKPYRNICVPLALLVGVLIYVGGTPKTFAQPTVVPNLVLKAPGLGIAVTNTPDAAAFKLAQDGKSWELVTPGSIKIPGAPWLTVQELRYDADPLLYGNVLVQNVSAVPQIYTFGFSLATTWPAPSLMRGSIDTSLIGTDALISAVTNSSIYTAQIDFGTVRTLQDYPFMLSTPQDAVSSSAQFGFELNNIPVNSSIGIQLRFTLSPGDTATIVSDFEVVQVPEPGTLALLLLGGVAFWFRRLNS